MSDQPITIRMAGPQDAHALRRLAALDSAPPLRGRVLLAELNRAPLAALALENGAVRANPSQHTSGAVRILRVLRRAVAGPGG
jgi:hypothetical protein